MNEKKLWKQNETEQFIVIFKMTYLSSLKEWMQLSTAKHSTERKFATSFSTKKFLLSINGQLDS